MTRNVVVLCLDTVREDFFRTFAPRLRAAADISFTQCRAASAWSTPSHASMLTGRLPSDHGVHVHALDYRRLAGETVLDDLEHRSIGVSANVYAGPAYGFDQLFDVLVPVSRYRRYRDGLNPVSFVETNADEGVRTYRRLAREVAGHDRPLESLANLAWYRANDLVRHGPVDGPELFDDGAAIVARESLDRVDDEPFVLFANVMDAHEPHRTVRHYANGKHSVPHGWSSTDLRNADVIEAPDRHRAAVRNYRTLYAAAVDYLDRWAVDLIDRLRRATDRETTVVVTADHGENLAYPAEDGLFGHLGSLSEGLLHVPLALVDPPAGYPETVDDYVSHPDLPELIAGLARGETPDVTRDRVASEVVGLTPNNEGLEGDRWDRHRRCVYEGDRKWTWDDARDGRVLELDPARPCWQRVVERRRAEPPDWAGEFFEEAIGVERRTTPETTDRSVDDSTRRRLAALGYR